MATSRPWTAETEGGTGNGAEPRTVAFGEGKNSETVMDMKKALYRDQRLKMKHFLGNPQE